MRAWCVLLLFACAPAKPPPAPPQPSPTPSKIAVPADATAPAIDIAPAVVSAPAPPVLPTCDAAVPALAKGEVVSKIDRDARELLSTAEHRAIGRAVKAYDVAQYEGKEARLIGEAYDRSIASGAAFEIQQAFTTPARRVALIVYPLATPASIAIDAGPRLVLVTSERGSTKWTAAILVSEDARARIVATIGDDLAFDHGERSHPHRQLWRVHVPIDDERSAIRDCD